MLLSRFTLVVHEDVERIIRDASAAEELLSNILSFLDRGITPPSSFIYDYVAKFNSIISDMVSITESLLKDEEKEPFRRGVENSKKYLYKAEEELITALAEDKPFKIRGVLLKYKKVFYDFVYGTLRAVHEYLKEASKIKLAIEVARRVGTTPEPEIKRKLVGGVT